MVRRHDSISGVRELAKHNIISKLFSRRATCSALVGLIAWFWIAPLWAAWYEASSENFVIYSRQSKTSIVQFAERLERYRSAMEWLFQNKTPPPSPSNRLTVFVVKSRDEVRRLHGSGNSYVQGFYMPSAGDSIAVVAPIESPALGI